MQLIKYECVIFDKTLVKSGEDTVGSWNPTYQEIVLKSKSIVQLTWRYFYNFVCILVILSTLKNSSLNLKTLTKDGDTHIALIDAIKNEYKVSYTSFI